MSTARDIGVVIPCRGDAAPLAVVLPSLRAMGISQICVADSAELDSPSNGDGRGDGGGGGRTDIAALCADHGARHFVSDLPRGARLRQAAAGLETPIFWFLHADANPAPDAALRICSVMDAGCAGGYFRFRFSGRQTMSKRIIEAGVALRCSVLRGTPYGDQGLFVDRDIYRRVGGHGGGSLFEEVPLVRALRRSGGFVSAGAGLLVDDRRWQQDGIWRRTFKNRILAVRFMLGADPTVLGEAYKRQDHKIR